MTLASNLLIYLSELLDFSVYLWKWADADLEARKPKLQEKEENRFLQHASLHQTLKKILSDGEKRYKYFK